MYTLKRAVTIALAVIVLSVAAVIPALADGPVAGRTPTIYPCWFLGIGYEVYDTLWLPADYGYDVYMCHPDGWHHYFSTYPGS